MTCSIFPMPTFDSVRGPDENMLGLERERADGLRIDSWLPTSVLGVGGVRAKLCGMIPGLSTSVISACRKARCLAR